MGAGVGGPLPPSLPPSQPQPGRLHRLQQGLPGDDLGVLVTSEGLARRDNAQINKSAIAALKSQSPSLYFVFLSGLPDGLGLSEALYRGGAERTGTASKLLFNL